MPYKSFLREIDSGVIHRGTGINWADSCNYLAGRFRSINKRSIQIIDAFLRSGGYVDIAPPPCAKQECKILELLQAGYELDPYKSPAMLITHRLSDVIFKLRKRGYDIETIEHKAPSGTKFGTYKLKGETKNERA
jgi:hypothetical protein